MVLFKKKTKPGEHEVLREGQEEILHINYEEYPRIPSIEEDSIVMSAVIEKLSQSSSVSRIIFHQKKKYEYPYNQTNLLIEIAQIYSYFIRQKKILTQAALEIFGPIQDASMRIKNLQYVILTLLRTDPVGAFVETKRLLRDERINLNKIQSEEEKLQIQPYLSILTEIYSLLNNTKLINQSKNYLDGYSLGNREVYKSIFRPTITPDFMYTRLISTPPLDGEEIDSYSIDKNTEVQIFNIKETIKPLYHLIPPEFKIDEDKYELLDLARKVLAEHQPKSEEFLDPEKMRDTFFNIGKDLLGELADHKNLSIPYEEIEEMARILVRYTVGFGLIEILLQDEEIQDISINSPAGITNVFVVHGKYGECITNIIPSIEDVDGWASKFRLVSARPLDEANPVLDTELNIPGARARVAIISKPLNPTGIAFSIRRHRDQPWTLPLFIKNKMINDLAAGLLSFLIDGSRTLLVAGTRGSGKCVSGDTLIQLSNGSIRMIKDLEMKDPIKISDGNMAFSNTYDILSLSGYNIKQDKAVVQWKREAPIRLIKVKTKSGREIITTPEHIYFSYISHNIIEKKAEDLKSNDFIAIPRKIKVNAKNQDIVIPIGFNPKETERNYLIKGKTNSQTVTIPKIIDEKFAEFLGYVIGDGHIDKEEVIFFNSNKKLRDHYKTLLNQFKVKFSEREDKTTWHIKVNSRIFSKFLNEVFEIPMGKKAKIVKIPEKILLSEDIVLAGFIRAYFDCDSHMPGDSRDLEFSSASHFIVKQLEMCLLRFGIIGFTNTKIVKGVIYHRLYIRGEFLEKYNELIGYNHPDKKNNLNKIIEKNIKSNTNVDCIPFGNKLVEQLRVKLRISPQTQKLNTKINYWNYKAEKNNISRNSLKKLMPYYSLRFDKLKQFEDRINILSKYLDLFEENTIINLEKIRKFFKISYVGLGNATGLSEGGIRRALNKNRLPQSFIDNLSKVLDIFENKLVEYESVKDIRDLVNKKIITYTELSKSLGIPESTLKYCFYKKTKPNHKNIIINNFLQKKYQNINEELKIIKTELKKLNDYKGVNTKEINKIILDLKILLNINSTELISENISIGTIRNISNSVYKKIHNWSHVNLAKNIIKVYRETVGEYNAFLLEEGTKLANSELFWDRIEKIEDLIDHNEEFVYDFTVENSHNFIANGLMAHNTSFLGSVLVEIMRKVRIIVVEDTMELPIQVLSKLGYNIQPMKVRSALLKSGSELSADEGIRTSLRMGDSALIVGEVRSSIRGNEEVLIIERGITKRIQIKELDGKDISNIFVPSMDFDLKFKLKKLTSFIKHPKRDRLLEVTTKTGRRVTVTPDHSLFTNNNFKITPIECQNLKERTKIIIPERLPCNYNNIQSVNLLELLEDEGCRIEGYEEDLKKIIKVLGYKKASKLTHCNNDIYQYLRIGSQHTNILIKDFKNLCIEANHNLDLQILQIKKGTSKTLSAQLEISKDFCRFLGYYVSEGWTDTNGDVNFSNDDDSIVDDMICLSRKLFNVIPIVRETEGLEICRHLNLNNKILGFLIKNLGCGRVALEKRVPAIIFGLSEEKIFEFLKGYFDGDGSQTSKLSSGNRISCSTISRELANDLLYLFLNLGIVARLYEKEPNGIGKHKLYIVEFKERRFVEYFIQNIGFKKYKKDLINRAFSHTKFNTVNYDPRILEKHVKLKRKFRHLRRYNSCGKLYLKKVVEECKGDKIITNFINGNFFLDEVKSIKEINLEEGEYVYDLSVEPCQNFVGGFGGIMLHNTESLALYEAMRTGALANTVAGTIHGDSPYGVFDRVVNDLGVPKTSFKATDIIIVANPVRSPDGLHSFRRVTQITEVRKEWENDPLRENGFVDLMKYDSKTDCLIPTYELINGDSEIIKSIGAQVKEWAGSWDAIWENILLRAKIKKTMVEYSIQTNNPNLLEAKDVIAMNDEFHKISERIRSQTGNLDSKQIFFEWEEALKRYIKLNY